MLKIEGNIIDIHQQKIFPGSISIEDGFIISIEQNSNRYQNFIAPGFVDAHVHIESSMLTPVEFSKLAFRCGTVGIVNDPHEIANVLGIEGIEYMLQNSQKTPLKTFFTIPSCVPATPLDVSGGHISSKEVEALAKSNRFIGLSEVMDVPGVLSQDPEIWQKIQTAHRYHLNIDGHAPGLKQEELDIYCRAGIQTDHECTSAEEAREKIRQRMKILIREGSAARNYSALKELISEFPEQVMFCTDDSHPGDLLRLGEIDKIVRLALSDGFDLFDVWKVASWNAIQHYRLPIGTLRVGDPADFIVFENLKQIRILNTFIQGIEVYSSINPENCFLTEENTVQKSVLSSSFSRKPLQKAEVLQPIRDYLTAIEIADGEIVTRKAFFSVPPISNFESDTEQDILKIVYLNRYCSYSNPQIGYIRGVGLKQGAFASSISHDSHNILAVGCQDEDIIKAINTVILERGGLALCDGAYINYLSLPIAGIMTDVSGKEVAAKWDELVLQLKERGCKLHSPFMTLSFMALLVVPELKIGEKGLFDFQQFRFLSEL